jgi:hypothetical protein
LLGGLSAGRTGSARILVAAAPAAAACGERRTYQKEHDPHDDYVVVLTSVVRKDYHKREYLIGRFDKSWATPQRSRLKPLPHGGQAARGLKAVGEA